MKRAQTRPVRAGSVTIGGGNPIVVQSMCATRTQDIEATVDEPTAKGVPFQRYDGFDQDERGTASMRADPYRGSPILRGTSLQS